MHNLSVIEQADLVVGLFNQYTIPIDEHKVRNKLACVPFRTIEYYLNDIGITVMYDESDVTTRASSVNNDKQWVGEKLRAFYRHLGRIK